MTRDRRNRLDPAGAARRANAADRGDALYARKRARQARRRAELDRQQYRPGPPDEDDWTVPDSDTDAVHRISKPTPIGDVVHRLVRGRGWDERLRGAEAWSRWHEIVGPALAERCEPVRLAGGTLVVRAESQVWATQLHYLTPQLHRNALDVLGDGAVRDIRIVVGPLERGDGSIR